MVGLAQALIEQDGGVVSEAAVDLLDTALALEPENFAARFWRAEAYDQLGETAQARILWRQMREKLLDNMPLAKCSTAVLTVKRHDLPRRKNWSLGQGFAYSAAKEDAYDTQAKDWRQLAVAWLFWRWLPLLP